MPPFSTEDTLRDLLQRATADLHAPDLRERPTNPLTLVGPGEAAPRPTRPTRRPPVWGLVGAAAAAAVVAGVLASSAGSHSGHGVRVGAPSPTLVPSGGPDPASPSGHSVLIELASVSKAVPVPPGRYAVQIERQTEGSTSYTKATVADSQTGDVWTYQRGDGVPTSLPMAPHLLPTAAELAAMPTDPTALRAALLAESEGNGGGTAARSQDAKVFEQAVQDLWDPLLGPSLRSALLTVIADTPGVVVNAHATDATGRAAVEISYDDTVTHQITSEYFDPSTGVVYELAFAADATASGPGPAEGSDVFLSLTRSDGPPTVDPLPSGSAGGTAPAPTPTSTPTPAPGPTPVVPAPQPSTASQTKWFVSPSGNISCELSAGSSGQAFCQETDPARSATLTAAGALSVCSGVSCLGNAPAGSPTLAYGSSEQVGAFRCESTTSGVTCTAAGKGFTISKSGVTPAS